MICRRNCCTLFIMLCACVANRATRTRFVLLIGFLMPCRIFFRDPDANVLECVELEPWR